jgi:hypothetical protein
MDAALIRVEKRHGNGQKRKISETKERRVSDDSFPVTDNAFGFKWLTTYKFHSVGVLQKGGFNDKGRLKMLQKYDISMDIDKNRILIKEFAVIGQKLRRLENYDQTLENYSMIHEVSYDVDIIRSAVQEGREVLIEELRSGDFFPTYPCVEIIADRVAGFFDGGIETASEVFFDDCTMISTDNPE